MMLCIIEKPLNNANSITYSLISPFGRIAISFPVHQLIPICIVQNINYETIATISFVQASKMFARGNVTATCDCKAKCFTKLCPCKRASISCSTKCHLRHGKCKNVDE